MYRKPIDIVIPVYNAYEDLVLCMRSIRRFTNLSWDRVMTAVRMKEWFLI
jgi:GT2 family glycosyltransferase